MKKERLFALASYVNKNDIVLDVGCDHGYLSIYLKQNNLCKEVYASDINELALNVAKNNFKKYNLAIKTFVSDGFKNIPVAFNTAVIAGLGTTKILNIIDNEKVPSKLIISSNNEHYKLRKELLNKGYIIEQEKVVLENKHYYVILLCIKGKQKLSKRKLKFGISNNKEYYKYLLSKNTEIIKKSTFKKEITIIL